MVKMKRPTPPKPAPIGDSYVCGGCGYEYVPELGDEDGEIAPGTLFEQLPADWVCPECAAGKDEFVKAWAAKEVRKNVLRAQSNKRPLLGRS